MANQAKEGQVNWRKTKGTFILRDGSVIRPGEIFMARPEDVPKVFRDTIVPVNPEELPTSLNLAPVESEPPNYTIRSRGPGIYDVLDGQDKVVNEKPMALDDAKRLVENLG